MNNPFEYSLDNKRYHTYNYYLRKKYGEKTVKIPLNAGFGCPNRDGTKGTGGCTYCSSSLSGEFAGDPCESIEAQYESVKARMYKKWDKARCIPYFQAGSGTYAPAETLRKLFNRALELDGAAGLNIATRADCIDEKTADLLYDISKRTDLEVELGLQTVFDKTALIINRCHSYDDFLKGYNLLKERNINICVHIIDGLPDETHDMMVETARTVGALMPHSMKIHLLYILKGTALCEQYYRNMYEFNCLDRNKYVQTVCDQLEYIPKEVIIQRLTGDGDAKGLVAPLWSLKKFCVLNEIDKEMSRRGSFQGKMLNG